MTPEALGLNSTTQHPDALFQSVGDNSRLRLLRLLAREELNVQEMVGILEMSQPGVSKHLAVLRDAGWLSQRRDGTRNWYTLVGESQFTAGAQVFAVVLQMSEQVAEAGRDDDALNRVLSMRAPIAGPGFKRLAEQWDRIRQSFEHADIQAGAVSALVQPGLRIIDIGTGTGALLPLLAETGAQVTAVDNSAAMLDKAKALCKRANLASVKFRKADIRKLPFKDREFDAAYCSMVLHHLDDPAPAVAEMARVVKPGGRVVVMAFLRHNQTWMRRDLAHAWLGFEQAEIENYFSGAGIDLQRWLVRGAGELPQEMRDKNLHWPDVFLAVGSVQAR
jgi:ubiquinone/menaquinone biosynthesis C-methylase UbiE/DNA-binding MarR family transcriptional regulator